MDAVVPVAFGPWVGYHLVSYGYQYHVLTITGVLNFLRRRDFISNCAPILSSESTSGVHNDTLAEWLRRLTRNQLGPSRVGSSPASVVEKCRLDFFDHLQFSCVPVANGRDIAVFSTFNLFVSCSR